MRGLRFFVRGLTRTIARRWIRRTIERRVVGSIIRDVEERYAARAIGRRLISDAITPETDGLLDDVAEQLDVFELLDLASEIPSIISNARDAAAAASVDTFNSLMEQFNPGQQTLATDYCMDYAEDYWETTDHPDPDEYMNGMFSQHEAIEQALSAACEMSFEAGRGAGAVVIKHALEQYIAEELISRGMDMAGVRRAQGDWGEFGDSIRRSEVGGTYEESGWVVQRGRQAGFANSMYIGVPNRWGEVTLARQLSGRQFMGIDLPYWFTERRRMSYAAMQGHMSQEELEFRTRELYQATYDNPFSTHRPAGYTPYSGPEWEYRGNGGGNTVYIE